MKKMLLMGYEGAGKTSMYSVIFANFPAKDTSKIGYTVQKQEHNFKFMGSLTLNLWDCGGQDTFMEQYFLVQKETIFKGVEVLIYVFDIEDKGEKLKRSLQYWSLTLSSVQNYNQNANIFVLIHKIDKIPQDQRKRRIENKKQQIEEITNNMKVKVNKFFATSIWDQTLYQAWSQIVQMLIPSQFFITDTLRKLCENSEISQAVLFERSTFLILSYYDEGKKQDLLTYEKVANIIKQFKLTCNKMGANIETIQVSTPSFTGMILQFTRTENILIIFKNKTIKNQLIQLNTRNVGRYFQEKKKQMMNGK